jgi:NADH:ubiquinone oxidoreductase subunit F (NADH-binding)/NADH:ubiquinone oxidoreductase subunit E
MNDRIARGTGPRKGTGLRTAPKGRGVDPRALAEVRGLLGDAPRRRDLLIEHLHRIQDRFGCIADRHLAALAQEMRMALAEVYEVATFYHHFDVVLDAADAPPAITVRVCDSIACELAGAKTLLEQLPRILGRDVRVVPAPCVGRCESAPAVVVGRHPCLRATPDAVKALVAKRALEHPAANAVKQAGAVDTAAYASSETVNPAFVDYKAYRAAGGYRLIADCLAGKRTREEITKIMEDAGLRGLGGAGFPAGRKWRIVAAEPAPRLMAVNIDEGEPGTFKDRFYLERDPHRFLEGMLVAAWASGVGEIYVYLRDEYAGCRAILAQAIAALLANRPCALPPIHLRRGAGAYICGEESAMIESSEGKRGMPRLRPPYVAQVGLFDYPTLEHNMETVYWVREIVERGAAWFAGHGRNGRKGLRSFSVSGRVKRPGVHLAPAGITVRELIDEYCGGMPDGHTFYAYLPGGASGGILPASMGDIPLDFDTLNQYGCFIGSAAIVILSQRDRATDAARNIVRFFRDESCGQCTPCRVGTAKALGLMASKKWDRALLEELCQAMGDASICGLGQAAPNPIRCVMKYFPNELE